MTALSVKDFYKEIFGGKCQIVEQFLNEQNGDDIVHFNVFNIAVMYCTSKNKPAMP